MIPRTAAVLLTVAGLATASMAISGTLENPVQSEQPATTSPIFIDPETVDLWRPLFRGTVEYNDARRRNLDPETALLRFIALLDLCSDRYGFLLSDTERNRITADFRDASIERLYNNAVLLPMVQVTDDEVEATYNAHRAAFQRPESAGVLEIFLWAPKDAADRSSARRLLEATAETATTAQQFKDAAREISDATSAYRGGAIGTVEKDGLSTPLRDVLFGGDELGVTRILESDDGLYLFFVTRRLAAQTKTLDEKTPVIQRKLRRQRFEEIKQRDSERLVRDYRLRPSPVPDNPQESSIAVRLGDEKLTFADLCVDPGAPSEHLETLVGSAAIKEIHRRELERLGIGLTPSDHLRLKIQLYAEMMNRISQTDENRAAMVDLLESARQEIPTPRVERWTFDLLRISPVVSEDEYFSVFRLCRDPEAATSSLANLGRLVEGTLGLAAELSRYDDVIQNSVAGLGPEIHSRLQTHLKPGERSTPIHLSEEAAVVVIELGDRRVDPEANRIRHEEKVRRRAAELMRAKLEDALLEGHEVVVRESDPNPGSDDEKK